ncbi:hypothetical protein OIO90_002445 [Microbotryomycetes sp. JL221]|nr:hypothetical protein OIO90_002445 [Microbotryomycetes sp. JL221]
MLDGHGARDDAGERAKDIGTLLSVYKDDVADKELAGLSIGLQEYYAPFPDSHGDLLLLGMPLATIFRNALPPHEPNLTMSIADLEGLGDGNLSAGRMRVALFGSLEVVPYNEDVYKSLTQSYELSHPDARGWDKGQAHRVFFARFRVNKVYSFGGFGDVAYIGWIPLDEYRAAGKRMRGRRECLKNWPVPQQPPDGALFEEDSESSEGGKTRLKPSSIVARAHSTSSTIYRRQWSSPWSSSSSWSSSNNGRTSRAFGFVALALIPAACCSPLLLDSPTDDSVNDIHHPAKPSLKTIKEAVERPDEDEFLISVSSLQAEARSRTLLGRTLRLWSVYVWEPIRTTLRFVHLAVLFLPVLLASPVLLLEYVDQGRDKRRGYRKREGERGSTRWWYRLLVHQMERAGPTFIKLAQWAGSRTDLFPAELCNLFGKLHSNGKPHSLRYTKRVLERAFGKPFKDIFAEFGENPMGIGAIAQVYKAVLRQDVLPDEYLDPKHQIDPSTTSRITRKLVPAPEDKKPINTPSAEVAIKVLHPGVEKMIARDLKIMMFFARALNSIPGMEWLSFPEEVQVFGEMMMSQIDLRIEANNLTTFEDNFKHRPTVSFPRALKKYTSRGVLVEEFEDAVPLETFLKHGGGPYDHRIANLGLDAFLHMLLLDDFTHADLHPGNIMVKFYKPTTKSILSNWMPKWFGEPEHDMALSESDVEIIHKVRQASKVDQQQFFSSLEEIDRAGYQPELVFIDAGLVTRLAGQNRHNFLDLFSAVTRFDGYEAGRLMVERCRTPDLVIDEEEFCLRMQHLVLSVKSQTFSLAKIRIADVLSEVLNNVRRHHVKMEADFVNTVISILLLEGIGRQLDPEMDLFKSAVPILRQLGKQLGPDQMLKTAGGFDKHSLGTMLKVWVWIEARQMLSMTQEYVDELVQYDL